MSVTTAKILRGVHHRHHRGSVALWRARGRSSSAGILVSQGRGHPRASAYHGDGNDFGDFGDWGLPEPDPVEGSEGRKQEEIIHIFTQELEVVTFGPKRPQVRERSVLRHGCSTTLCRVPLLPADSSDISRLARSIYRNFCSSWGARSWARTSSAAKDSRTWARLLSRTLPRWTVECPRWRSRASASGPRSGSRPSTRWIPPGRSVSLASAAASTRWAGTSTGPCSQKEAS
mmetsp:Transcript_2654/g.6248  ORF Transcript_2654/g.6248 Transcript_2654/m.6248 type:complete len:231 (-) Transcript_2654:265-957(-)